jgi:two-component system, NarL family, response regulator LiaR
LDAVVWALLGKNCMVTVALIDGAVEQADALSASLKADVRFEALQRYDSGSSALEAARKGKFSVVLIELRLANDSGLRWIRRLRESCPGLRIVAYTGVDSEESIVTAIESGADGYLLKQEAPAAVAEAILEVVKGFPVASGPALRALFRHVRREFKPGHHQSLSRAEVRVLELSARGYDCKTVANKLGISVQTVYVHNRRIFRKLGVTNRLAAIAKFQERESPAEVKREAPAGASR